MIVDDSAPAREVLRALVEADDCLTVCGEAENGEDAVTLAWSLKPDVVVMDFRMPGLDGIKAARAITSRDANVRVILATASGVDALPAEAYSCGAVAVCDKARVTPTLIQTSRPARLTRSRPNPD
jgi:DNA-binding NarL/FixJ family response regulator